MPTSATAAVLHDPHGQFTLQEVELDDPRSDEILVRIEASGVCHTDEMAKGMLEPPMVLGHEGTGVGRSHWIRSYPGQTRRSGRYLLRLVRYLPRMHHCAWLPVRAGAADRVRRLAPGWIEDHHLRR